jgi:hypothetical protein
MLWGCLLLLMFIIGQLFWLLPASFPDAILFPVAVLLLLLVAAPSAPCPATASCFPALLNSWSGNASLQVHAACLYSQSPFRNLT